MRSIRFICCLALAAGVLSIGGPQGGVAQVAAQTVDVRQACTPDAMRLCSEFVPDEAKITACMHRKYAQIGAECRSAMAAGHKGGSHHARHRRSS
jgi:hypothetical protein